MNVNAREIIASHTDVQVVNVRGVHHLTGVTVDASFDDQAGVIATTSGATTERPVVREQRPLRGAVGVVATSRAAVIVDAASRVMGPRYGPC